VRPSTLVLLATLALLALAPATAAAKVSTYTVAQAQFDVEETQTYKSGGKGSWTGNGHQHETQQADHPELPSLPIGIPKAGGAVSVITDLIFDGDETLVDAEGKKEECSGVWEEEADGALSVRIKADGDRLQAIWEIPHGISSKNCGAQRDLMPAKLTVKSNVAGAIGDNRLILETSGTKKKTSTTVGTEKQTLKWKARVVLKLFTAPTPAFPGKPPIHR
jgi:hypothetical protein